jgi:phage protein D
MAEGLSVLKPYLYVEIDNQDVSAHITPFLKNFVYVDNDGIQYKESDDVEIELVDTSGFFRKNPPARGSCLKIKFGYENRIRNAGVFFIDSYSYKTSRDGDIFTIKALAKDVKSSYRTIKTTAFENTTLRSLAQKIASKHGYELDFKGADISFTRLTQQEKRDLQFLSDICQKYGYICKVSNKKLVVRELEERLGEKVIFELTRENILELEISVSSLYEAEVEVIYLNPQKKDTIADRQKAQIKASGDTKKLNVRVENKLQAQKLAKAQKLLNEMKEVKGRITASGIPDIYASSSVSLKGFDVFDRVYYIARAEHRISRENGYITELEILKNPKKEG